MTFLQMNLLGSTQIRDGSGVYGYFMHYSMVFALVGSAIIIFIYLWRNGRLDMDEEAKFQMMRQEEEIIDE